MNSGETNQGAPAAPAKLSALSVLLRLLIIGVVLGGITVLFAYAGGYFSPHELTPARLTDGFEQTGGLHPGFRRNHAKGVCVSGYFESNGAGAELSKAMVFQAGRVPVIGRFSLPGGNPYAPDTSSPVRGLGLRFAPAGGGEWRTAMVTLPVFVVRTPQGFYDLMLASAPDPATGKPDPAKMQAFFAKYPDSAKILQGLGKGPKPAGFEGSAFNGLNAFRFINGSGTVSWVRWSFVPQQTSETMDTGTNQNFLFDELIASVHKQPLQWHLILTVAGPGDPTDDATVQWPEGRRKVDAGTLTIDRVESDDTSLARNLNFDPLILPDEIAASDDPLLSARSAVYSQSFTRREGEPKGPSAISSAETEK